MSEEGASNFSSARETMETIREISRLLNTGLTPETLAICVRLCENGVNPEALALVIQELQRETAQLKAMEGEPEQK